MIAWVLILYGTGIVLIMAEFIVPGMICGILGGLLVVSSAVLGYYHLPEYIVMLAAAEVVGVFVAIALGMFMLARTRAGKRLILSDSQQAHAGWVAAESDTSLLHAEGEVYTALRPAGTVLVNRKRVDAVSEGAFIDKGTRIRVIAVHGSRVVVEQVIE